MPAWNEQEAIGGTLRELRLRAPQYDVLVVNDGSTDHTSRVVREAGATVLDLPCNMGVGGAMRAGFEYARANGYDQVIQVDADGQHDPKDIDAVFSGLERADISIGARFADKGNYTVHGPRRWAMAMLACAISRLAGTRLTDVTSGFRAADRTAIEQYCRYYPAEYLGDTVDSLVMAVRCGCSVVQVPVEMRPRQAGVPSQNPWRAAAYLGRSVFALLVSMTRRPLPPEAR